MQVRRGRLRHIGPLYTVRIRRNVTVIGTFYRRAMWASPPTAVRFLQSPNYSLSASCHHGSNSGGESQSENPGNPMDTDSFVEIFQNREMFLTKSCGYFIKDYKIFFAQKSTHKKTNFFLRVAAEFLAGKPGRKKQNRKIFILRS